MRRRQLLASAAGGLASAVHAAEPATVTYPRHEALQDSQVGYILRLMGAALTRSGHRYTTRQAPALMVQSRALIELARPEPSIDVFWTMSNTERERHLLPVRIPIDRGLLGWRIALVRRADLARWKGLRQLSELSLYTAGQMHDWPDTDILRANGLPVQTSTRFQGLFSMLAMGRIDYFPRSLLEIAAERDQYQHMALEIEPHLLLHYPAALYFFVTPSRPQLAEDLRQGLELMQADGSFELMFQHQFASSLTRFKLGQRRILHLSNPLLPEGTPLQRKALWWDPKI